MRLGATGCTLLLTAVFTNSACIDLDRKYEVLDLRILAMRLDPPEVLYSPFLALPAAERPPVPGLEANIQATVLAVDPRGAGGVEFISHVCPASSNELCRNYALDDETRTVEHDLAQLQTSLRPLLSEQSAMLHPDERGTISGALGHYSFDARALEFVLPHDPATGAASTLFQEYARVIVRARSRGTEEVAFRRIPFNVSYDFSFLPPAVAQELRGQFAEFLGIEFCNPNQTEQRHPSCLKVRGPNRNPSIVEFKYSMQGKRPTYDELNNDTLTVGQVVDGPVRLEAGQEIVVWPVLTQGDSEPYQVFEIDLQQQSINLANYEEQMAVSWYADRDVVQLPVTSIVTSRDLATNYTYPVVDPPDQVRLWAIVQDQRGGVAWGHVDLVLR